MKATCGRARRARRARGRAAARRAIPCPAVPSVLIVRGHLSTPWELRPWLELPERFEVSYLLTRSNRFAKPDRLEAVPARSLRDLFPSGPLGELSTGVLGDRYLSAEEAFKRADI